jgi:ribosome-associated toxin RatA of RatAB toxin-antitoxin module
VFIALHPLKSSHLLVSFFGAIALTTTISFVTPLPTQAASSPIAQLSSQEQTILRSGQVSLTGKNGQYTCRVIVSAPVATVWKLLTDYNNFENYFPNVASSQILEAKGNRKIFEQVYLIQALIFSKRARVRIASTETYPRQINFNLVEGDVNALNGVWRLDPLSSNQVLVTHQVSVDPGSDNRALFFGIYEDTLEKTLQAVKQRSEQQALGKRG